MDWNNPEELRRYYRDNYREKMKDPEFRKKRVGYCKNYRERNPEKMEQYWKDYYAENSDKFKKRANEWYETHKTERNERLRTQWASLSPEERSRIARKQLPELKKWRKENPVKRRLQRSKQRDKRRELEFIPINKPFKDSEGHHVDKKHVLYIPRDLHRSIKHSIRTGKNMKEINDKAFKWLKNTGIKVEPSLPIKG